MRAAWYEKYGPAREVFQVGDMPTPVAGPGEVLVRVHASGVNPSDWKSRTGSRGPELPYPRIVPHSDGSGVIEAVGDGVDAGRVGERVWLWNAQGGYGTAGRAFGTAATHVRALPPRIGANHTKVGSRSQILVSDSGWYEDDIARSHRRCKSWFSAKLESCGAAVDAKDFVSCAMIVVKSVHTVTPAASPSILREQSLERGSGFSARR